MRPRRRPRPDPLHLHRRTRLPLRRGTEAPRQLGNHRRPESPDGGVRELRHRVRDLGFKGLRIVPWLWEAPPTDRRYYPLFAACVELGVPFFTRVGHTGPLRPSETGRPIPYIDQIALDFPELVIVCGHIGYPWT